DRIRSGHLLRALTALAPVHVGCLTDGADSRAALAELDALAASHCIAPQPGPLPLVALGALARGLPVSVAAFASRELAEWVV
ncbi:hypothetical protein ABTK63_20880, partial [Acinetobacter baumannii]